MSQFAALKDSPLWKLLADFGDPGALEQVSPDDRELWLGETAVQIAKNGKPGLEFLLDHLGGADEARARAILTGLCFLAPRVMASRRDVVRQRLLECLDDSRPLVVADAVDALKHLDFNEALAPVRRLLRHRSPFVVGSALRYLSRHFPREAAPLLKKALQSSQPIVRQNAIDELDDLGCVQALPLIRPLLQDDDKDVRQAAKTAVANLEEMKHAR